MKLTDAWLFPVSFYGMDGGRSHESLLRSHAILGKVKEMLSAGTPPSVVLETIEVMEREHGAPFCCLMGETSEERPCSICQEDAEYNKAAAAKAVSE